MPVLRLTGDKLPLFAVLLVAMVAELIVNPFIVMETGSLLLARALWATVLLAAFAVAGSRRTAVVLFGAAIASVLVATVTGMSSLRTAAQLFRLVFLCYVLMLVIRRVLSDRTVTLDTVAGAACAYVLMGIVWGDLFNMVEGWRPGSFHVPASWTTGAGRDMRSALMYFSFATLTTLGYGEIHPTDAAAGSLCAAEAVVGQLYLAIMIARMVGLHTSQRSG